MAKNYNSGGFDRDEWVRAYSQKKKKDDQTTSDSIREQWQSVYKTGKSASEVQNDEALALRQQRNALQSAAPTATGNRDAEWADYYANVAAYGKKWGDSGVYDEAYTKYNDAMNKVSGQYASHEARHQATDKKMDTFLGKLGGTEGTAKRLEEQEKRYNRDVGLYNRMARDANQTGSEELWNKAAHGYTGAVQSYGEKYADYMRAESDARAKELGRLKTEDPGYYTALTSSAEDVTARLEELNAQRAEAQAKKDALYKELQNLQKTGQVAYVDSHGIGHYGKIEDDYDAIVADLYGLESEISKYENAAKHHERQQGQAIYEQYLGGGKILPPEIVRNAETGKAKYEADRKAAEEKGAETLDYGMNIVRKVRSVWRSEKDKLEEAGWDPTFDDASNLNSEDQMLFYALYAEDPEKAMLWARYANNLRNEEYEGYMAEWAGESGWNAAAAFLQALGNRVGSGAVNLVDPHSATANQLARTASGLLSGGSQLLNEWSGTFDTDIPILRDIINGKGLGDFYQLANSILESGINAYAAGKLGEFIPGGGAEGIGALGVMLMGSSASAADYNECIKRGLTPGQAQKHALAAGINEALFEFVSMDKLGDTEKLLQAGTIGKKIKAIFIQSGVEASEEFCTTVANRLADAAQARRDGYDSQIENRAKELIALGMSRDEALEKAEKEWLTELINDAIGGFISGGAHDMAALAVTAPARAVSYVRGERAANQAAGVASTNEQQAAMRAYAEANGIEWRTAENAAQAVKQAETATQNAENAEQKQQAKEQPKTRQEKRQERREEKAQAKSEREIGADVRRVQEHIDKQLAGKSVQEQTAIRDKLVQQYGEAIAPAVYSAVRTNAYQQAAQNANPTAIQAAKEAALEGVTDQDMRRAVSSAYDQAAVELAVKTKNTDALGRYYQQIRGTGTGSMTMEAIVKGKDGQETRSAITGMSEDGNSVTLADGSTVAVKDLQADADTMDIIHEISALGLGKNTDKVFQAYKKSGKTGLDGYRWIMDYTTAIDQGRNRRISLQEAIKRSSLDAETVMEAYEMGHKETMDETRKAVQKNENRPKRKGVTGRVANIDTSAIQNEPMSKQEREQFDLANQIFELLGVDVKWESSKTKNGKYVGANGSYLNGTVTLDIHAGRNDAIRDINSGILATTGHELTHFLQEYAPEQYQALKEFVLQQIVKNGKYGEATLERMIQDKQNRSSKKLTKSQAEDEVVADACQTMLRDSKALREFAEQRPEAAKGIIQWLADWFKKIKAAFSRSAQLSEQARFMEKLEKDVREAFGQLWDDALREAVRMHDEIGNMESGDNSQNSDRDYNSTVILEESTIDKYLRDYAAKTSPNYAQAYIVRMSPDDFLNLTTSKTGRDTIWKQTGDLDVDKLKKATIDQPFQLNIDTKSGQVEGHEGRHRAMALYNNGVKSIPVLLFDSGNKYSKTALDSLDLKGQDFGKTKSNATVTVQDVQPLSYANRDNVVQKFTTQPTMERMGEKYGNKETIRYSDRDTEYLELAKDPEKNAARLQEMVDEAARKAGYTSPMLFHGTNAFGFTTIKTSKDVHADGFSFWAANKESAAGTYTRYGKTREIKSEISYEETEEAIEERSAMVDEAIDEFRYLIDRTFSEWFYGQQGNEEIRRGVDDSNPEPGSGDGVYDFLVDQVADAFYEYSDSLSETYEDFADFQERSEDWEKIEEAIVGIEGAYSALSEIQSEGLVGGIYELYADTDNMYIVDAKGAAWDALRPEGLPKIERGEFKNIPYKTRDVANWARDNGYDGVIFKNIKDNGAYGRTEPFDVYAFFNPQAQVKSADPVTYDDSGNVIPLSERFNPEQEDIRYSERDYDTPTDTDLLMNASESDATNPNQLGLLKDYKALGKRAEILQKRLDALMQEKADREASGKEYKAGYLKIKESEIAKLEREMEAVHTSMEKKMLTPQLFKLLEAERDAAAKIAVERKDEVFARYKERKNETALRGRIKNLHDEMNRDLLKPREGHFVPQGLIRPVVDLLDMVNTQTKRAKSESAQAKIDAINAAYDRIKNDERYSQYYDETVKEMLTELSATLEGRSIYELSYSELEDVYTVMKAMRTTIRNSIKADMIEKGKEVFEIGNALRQELRAGKGANPLLLEKYHMAMLSAERAFHRFGGYMPDSTWDKTYRMLDNAQLKALMLEMQATRLFDSVLLEKADFAKAEALTSYDKKDLVDVGLKDADGNAVPITRGMMLSIYMHLQNEENTRHLMYGGLTLPDFRRYYKGQENAWGRGSVSIPALGARVANLNELLDTVGEAGVAAQYEAEQQAMREMWESVRGAIEDHLSEYDRKWIAASKDFFDNFSRRELNRVTNEMYGFSKAKVDNYFPIVTDKNFLKTDFDSISRDISLENAGFMKERVKAGNPILLEDITKAVNRQISNVARYAGLTQALKTFNNVYNVQTKGYTDSVKKAMSETFEDTGKKYIENLITDMVGGRTQPGTIFDRIKGNYAQAVLSANLSVTIKQAASFWTAAATVGWKPLMKALAKGGQKGRVISRADKSLIGIYTPLLWKRSQGAIDTEIGDMAHAQDWTKKAKWLMGWIEKTDIATVGRLWYAAEYYVKENFDLAKGTEAQIKNGESPFYQKVAEVFNQIVEDTQPNYTILQRPDILRNPNKLVRAMTMFSTQRFQNANILIDAAGEYNAMRRYNKQSNTTESKAALKSAKQKLTRAISSQVVSAAVLNVMTLVAAALMHRMNPWRDDDDEITAESIREELMNGFLSTMAGSFLAGSELYEAVSSMLTGSKYYGNDVGGISTINEFATAVVQFGQQAVKLIGDENSKPSDWTKLAEKQLAKVGQYLAQMTGIPAANIYKIIAGGKNHIIDAVNGEFFSFEAGVERSNATNARRFIKALEAGDKAKAEAVMEEMQQNILKDKPNLKADKVNAKIQSAVQSYVKQQYLDDEMSEEKAIHYMVEYGSADDENDAFWKIREWEAREAWDGEADDFSFSKYTKLREIIDNVGDISEEMQYLQDHGVKFEDANKEIKSYIGKQLKAGEYDEDEAMKTLQAYHKVKDEKTKQYRPDTDDEAWFTVQEWAANAEHADEEDYSWSKYEDMFAAMDNGGDIEPHRDEMESHGIKEDTIKNAVVAHVKERYEAGEVDASEAMRLLQKYRGMDANEAYWKVDEWDAKETAEATGDDFTNSNYRDLYAAIDANADASAAIKELTAHGYKERDVYSAAKDHLVERFEKGEINETQLKNQLSRYAKIVKQDEVSDIVTKAKCYKETGYRIGSLNESYLDGEITAEKYKQIRVKYGGKTADEAKKQVRWLDLKKAHPDLDITESVSNNWYDGTTKTRENGHESAKAAGMSIEAYMKSKAVLDEIKDSNDNGTGEDEYIAALAKMNLTPRQKDALYYEKYKGGSRKGIYKTW